MNEETSPRKSGLSINHIYPELKIEIKETINIHSDRVTSLCILKDRRLCSSSLDNTIKVFNSKTYKCEMSLEGHTQGVYYVTLLDNGDLASSSIDKTIRIWSIGKNDYKCIATIFAHKNKISKVIQISKARLASCSYDKTIKIWSSNPPFKCIAILEGHTFNIESIIELKNKQYIVSVGGYDRTVRFWSNDYTCAKVIKGILSYWNNSLIEIENNKLVVGELESWISIVNCNTMQIETKIQFNGRIRNLSSIIEFKKGTILCGSGYGQLIQIEIKEYHLLGVKSTHNFCISGLLILENNDFISCSYDNSIKVWSLKVE